MSKKYLNNLLVYFSNDSHDKKIYDFIRAIVKVKYNSTSEFLKFVLFDFLVRQNLGTYQVIQRDNGEHEETFVPDATRYASIMQEAERPATIKKSFDL